MWFIGSLVLLSPYVGVCFGIAVGLGPPWLCAQGQNFQGKAVLLQA
jgi:hypothetical protein